VFKFITGKPLWVNILFSIVLVFILLFLFLLSLNLLTKHGNTLTIPSVVGVAYPDAKKMLESNGFEMVIQDSVYVDTAAPLSILRQFPEADAVVKENRTVYLTINRAVAPSIEMPNFINMTFRSAEMALKQYGLKLEDTVYRTDFAKNAVLDQTYNGTSIKPGTKILMGSSITLILGSGLGEDEFSVPDLFALSYPEALTLLESNNLTAGSVVVDPDVRDTASAFVYRQRPERIGFENRVNRIRPGQSVDIWLGLQKPVRMIDSTLIPPPSPILNEQ
jgi:eukaryotic-like serine/threonine-protein kinase